MAIERPSRVAAALLAVALVVGPAAAQAQQQRTPAGPSEQAVLELLNEVNRLQSLLQELRGTLEVQGHRIEQLRTQQRQALADFDRRLRQLEQQQTQQQTQAPARVVRPPQVIVTPPIGGGEAAGSPPASAAPAPAQRPATASQSEQGAYDTAFDLMKQGRYGQAAIRFREFLVRFPQGALADNAQYWIGEAAYVTRDFRTALEEFNKVLTGYPDSAKVPDAMLKIGYTYYELGEYAKARETLSQVMARYPSTAVARSAELRIDKIAREGH